MTVLDYFVLVVVVASVASGATKGLLKGTLSIASAVAGLFAAVYSYGAAAKLFRLFGAETHASNLLGFLAVFIGVVVAGALLARSLRAGLRSARLGWVDHTVGAVFGLVRAWLICSVVYLALTSFPVKLAPVEQAVLAPALLEGTKVIAYATSPQMREQFLRGYAAVKGLWREKG